MNGVGLPKGVQPRLGEGGDNVFQRNNNITNDFFSVGVIYYYGLLIVAVKMKLVANLKISNFQF